MAFQVSVRPEAEADLAFAYKYYQECRIGLGDDFLLCVEESLSRISKNPFLYQPLLKTIRRALTHRFPYGVYFVVLNHEIVVIAVLHAARMPQTWMDRT